MKNDIADDLERHFRYYKRFAFLCLKNAAHIMVPSQLGIQQSIIVCEQLFLLSC